MVPGACVVGLVLVGGGVVRGMLWMTVAGEWPWEEEGDLKGLVVMRVGLCLDSISFARPITW